MQNIRSYAIGLCVLVSASTYGAADTDRPLEACIHQHNGRPVIAVNGRRQYPMIYALTEHGRFTWEDVPARNLKLFAELGFTLYQIDGWLDRIWSRDGSIDLPQVRRQLRGVLTACPEAAIFIRVHVRAPGWWLDDHPESITEFADRAIDPRAGDLGSGRRRAADGPRMPGLRRDGDDLGVLQEAREGSRAGEVRPLSVHCAKRCFEYAGGLVLLRARFARSCG